MRLTRNLSLVVFAFAGTAWLAGGQDNPLSPRKIVDRAIKAQGNPDKVAKIRALHAKGKGKIHLMGGIAMTMESYFRYPDKFKNIMDLEIKGMNVPVITVFDGKKFWVSAMGKVIELKDEKILKEMKESIHLDKLGLLVGLKAKEIELSALGETKIDGKAAVGVRVSSKGHRDINFYFDKKTFLLLKSEHRGVDALSMKEANIEKYFGRYKDFDGIRWPQRMRIVQDGKDFIEVEISEYRLPETLDDSIFAMP